MTKHLEFECPACGILFISGATLARHVMKKHTPEKGPAPSPDDVTEQIELPREEQGS